MIIDGTTYHHDTSMKIVRLLEHLRLTGQRVRFYWGDTKTGLDWGDTYGVAGTIGRSTGKMKVPLLIHNARSMGGGAILTHCIVRIRHANKQDGGDLYRHPDYHVGGDE